MKRVSIALMLIAMLFCVFGSTVVALDRPYDADSWQPDGDDHPWGGDESSSDPTPIKFEVDSPQSFTTSSPLIEVIYYRFLLVEVTSWFSKPVSAVQKHRSTQEFIDSRVTVNTETKGM